MTTTAGRMILALRAELERIREREGKCCPEDVGFDEYIRALEHRNADLVERMRELLTCSLPVDISGRAIVDRARRAIGVLPWDLILRRHDINRETYQKLVDEDIAWLEKQPRTLERMHVIEIVRQSPEMYYGKADPS